MRNWEKQACTYFIFTLGPGKCILSIFRHLGLYGWFNFTCYILCKVNFLLTLSKEIPCSWCYHALDALCSYCVIYLEWNPSEKQIVFRTFSQSIYLCQFSLHPFLYDHRYIVWSFKKSSSECVRRTYFSVVFVYLFK